jgi:hypothetical protein
MTGNRAVDWVITAAALITALYVVWRKVVVPAFRAVKIGSEVTPTLLTIAEEFQPNHGTSLRDQVDKIIFTQDEMGKTQVSLDEGLAAQGEVLQNHIERSDDRWVLYLAEVGVATRERGEILTAVLELMRKNVPHLDG